MKKWAMHENKGDHWELVAEGDETNMPWQTVPWYLTCKHPGCSNPVVPNSDYCALHESTGGGHPQST